MAWITLPCGLIQFPLTVPHTILLGSQVPGTGGAGSDGSQPPAQYYAAMEGDSQIYTIGSYLTETAAKGLTILSRQNPFPMWRAPTSGKSLFPGTGRPAGSVKGCGCAGNIAWYKDSAADESNRLDDNGALNNLADIISGLSFQSCVSYKASDEELSGYGLSDPTMILSWTYESGDTNGGLTLLIGSLTEDGTGYYTRKDDSRAVNLISKEAAVRCLNAAYPK